MRRSLGALLIAGLLAACGGVDTGAETQPAQEDGAAGDVTAMACSDCPWLYVRCMSRATTPEAQATCEEARLLCEETFCTYGAAAE